MCNFVFFKLDRNPTILRYDELLLIAVGDTHGRKLSGIVASNFLECRDLRDTGFTKLLCDVIMSTPPAQ